MKGSSFSAAEIWSTIWDELCFGTAILMRPSALTGQSKQMTIFKKLLQERRHAELIDHQALGSAARLAIPTYEHYLPMLYAIALQREDETISFFNDMPVAGSLTMTSFTIC